MVQKLDLGTTTALIPGNQPTGDQRTEPAAHTPGPWEVFNHVHVNTKGRRLLTVQGPFGDPEKSPNARLIAAAPDMLAALKVALNEIHHPGACAYEKGRDITDFLEAIIAKAEGR